jgi:hypothetical protein
LEKILLNVDKKLGMGKGYSRDSTLLDLSTPSHEKMSMGAKRRSQPFQSPRPFGGWFGRNLWTYISSFLKLGTRNADKLSKNGGLKLLRVT